MSQCYNGHIICAGCLLTLREHGGEASHICPKCRAYLGQKPIRNLFAETVIGDFPGQCEGCNMSMLRKELVSHRQQCDKITVECPYSFAMCAARPRRTELDAHMHTNHADHIELLAIAPMSATNRIVALLSGVDADDVKMAAAEALWNLSFNDDNAVAIGRAGAIAPLVALLSAGGSDKVKELAAGALGNLAINPDNEVAIAQAGAIAPLVALLSRGGTDEVKEAAARALGNLACNADTKVTIAQAGAIVPLLGLWSKGGTDEVKEQATRALWNLGVLRAAKRERDDEPRRRQLNTTKRPLL